MAKAPAFQFYVNDYIGDTRSLSLAAKGAWVDCLCEMWLSVTRGRISKPLIGYARFWGCSGEQAQAVLDELITLRIADGVTERNGNITLTNRRMYSESLAAEANNNRQKRYRDRHREPADGESNGKVTLLSSSPTSSSDLKRLIDACVREHEGKDPRLIEIAVIETMLRRKGSAAEAKPIKSSKYFNSEITLMLSEKGAGGLGDDARTALLKKRRQDAEKHLGVNLTQGNLTNGVKETQ